MAKRPKVLFVCTHNSARSQMAEAFLRRYGADFFEAHSAGLHPGEIHPYTYQVMREVGIDLAAEGHRSKGLIEEYFIRQVHVGYLITVCQRAEAECPTYPGVSVRQYWEIEDPVAFQGSEEEKLARFRAVRDEIEARVKAFIAAEKSR